MILRHVPCHYTYSRNKCGFIQKNLHYKKNVLNTTFFYRPAQCITHYNIFRKSLPLKKFKHQQLSNVRNIFY